MIDTYSDETGALDFTRSSHGSGMSNRAAARALVNALQQHFKRTLENLFTVDTIKQIAQVMRAATLPPLAIVLALLSLCCYLSNQRKGIVVKDFDSLLQSLNQNGYLLMKGRSTYQLQATG